MKQISSKFVGSKAGLDTPTIVNKLAQWLESPDCLQKVQSYEKTGELAANPAVNYVNMNTKSGGTTTILNPTSFIRISELIDVPDTDQIPVVVNQVVEEQKLPLPVVQTNRKRTMITRSLSRQASVVKDDLDNDPDYEPESPVPVKRARRGVAGRKPASRGDGLDGLPADEREKVILRRQKNKEAAARCRQKRVDLTNKLAREVEQHLTAKIELQEEIKRLRMEQDQLRSILETHKLHGCPLETYRQDKPLIAIKSAPVLVEAAHAPYASVHDTAAPLVKPLRPQTLLGLSVMKPERDEDIETPSKIVANLFEASGFTPSSIFPTLNTPTCSIQQRSLSEGLDLSSPTAETISLTAL